MASWHRTRLFWLVILLIIISLIILKYFNFWQEPAKPARPPVSVVTTKATVKDFPVYLSALGNVTPLESITVKTQVNGILLRVLFKEGQMVKAGELLAEIDCRPYEAQLLQYQGQLARDQALLANALIDLKRYQTLWKQDSVAQQTLATQASLVKQYQAAIQLDEGQLAAVKVNISYCKIPAPVDGRVGLRLVDPGNLVQTSDTTGIVILNRLDPMTVIFSIPGNEIPQVVQQTATGKTLAVKAFNSDGSQLLAQGTLLTLDNQIDPLTGTVRLRALFDNKDNHLFPSQFVNIKVLVNTFLNAVVVPTAAIQFDPNGAFVFVANQDIAKVRKVTIGVTAGNETTVQSGLNPGEFVVIEGTDKLTDNAKIRTAKPKTKSIRLALSQWALSFRDQVLMRA